MKNVVFISYLFAPLARAAGVNRAYLVKYLSEAGWAVDVITGESYRSLFLVFQKDPSLLDVLPPGVRVHRYDSLAGWLRYDLGAFRRKLLGGPQPVRKAWIDDATADYVPKPNSLILATLSKVDNALVAHRMAEKHGLPLAFHFVDDTRGIDAQIIKRAGLLTAVTRSIRDNLYAEYRHPNIEVINHGYAQEVEVAPDKPASDPLKIAYAGSCTFRMPPDRLLKAYARLRRKSPELAKRIRFDFYSHRGGFYYNLFLRRHACDHVRFMGYLGIGKLVERLREYDMGLACARADLSFSSKTYNYLNAALPIFAASDHPGLRDFVNEHDIGLACDLDVGNLTAKLEWLATHQQALREWRQNVLAIRQGFSMKEQVRKLSEHLLRLMT